MPAVLFDVDGTLLDSVDLHARAWCEAFRTFGKVVPFDRIRAQMGKGGDQVLPMFFTPAELAARGREIEGWRSHWYRHHYLPRVRPFPGVRSLFQSLRGRGWIPMLATSASEDELGFYVDVLDVGDLIDAVTSRDDAPCSEPSPDIFAAALERAPQDQRPGAWVVGDSPWDALAATRLGLPTVGLRAGGFPERDLLEAGVRVLFDGPWDLQARLDASPFDPRG